MTLRVGLTGGIGSGKTAVSDRLAELGAVIVDADLLAREVVARGTTGLAAVTDRFGPGVLDDAGDLDRPALAGVVFADPAARRDLEAIIHPLVRARAAELSAAAAADAVVVQVIPLLVETGQSGAFDVVCVVDLEPELQLARVLGRDDTDEEQARRRIAAQADRRDRLAVADVVLDNNGDPDALVAQVDQLWVELRRRAAESDPH